MKTVKQQREKCKNSKLRKKFTFLLQTLTVSDKDNFEKIPDVPGLLSYRADNQQLYVNQGSKWQALGKEKEVGSSILVRVRLTEKGLVSEKG